MNEKAIHSSDSCNMKDSSDSSSRSVGMAVLPPGHSGTESMANQLLVRSVNSASPISTICPSYVSIKCVFPTWMFTISSLIGRRLIVLGDQFGVSVETHLHRFGVEELPFLRYYVKDTFDRSFNTA